MKYLKKFETTSAYNAAKSGLILPNVSLITENYTVEYNPSSPTPPTPSHDYVEIGDIKWATMNIGANSITDTGLYFQWGDTQGYTAAQVGTDKQFTWGNYKYAEGSGSGSGSGAGSLTMTKYNESDGLTVLQPSDDAVTAAWGGNWRMPTKAEFQALGSATTSAWTADYEGSGVSGLVLTSKSDSSKVVFFPAAGGASVSGLYSVGISGFYWSSSLYSDYVDNSYELWLNSSRVYWNTDSNRYSGYSVRGVLDE